ncbi:MAG: hypothetical protein ACE5FR_07380 [Rhodospirillales bacterium]
MTVSSTQSRKDYAGDGATTQFTVPYFFIENADIVATLRSTGGTETTWTEGTEYTLTGAGVPSGGTLTAVSTGTDFTPQSGETLVIKRKEQFTQPSDFAVAGALPSETIEEGYDRAVMLAQQMSEDLGRVAKLAETSPTTSELIIPEPEADKALSWNSAGDNLTNGPTVAQITQASSNAAQAAASATAAANSASAATTSATNAAASATAAANSAKTAFLVAVTDETTAITTGTAKVTFRIPFALTLTDIRASLTTASTSGVVTVDVNEGGTSILSTKLTIDATEKTSETAATPAVVSDTALADDAEITIDIDTAGSGAKGLKVTFVGDPA